jgi:hypothetical protein
VDAFEPQLPDVVAHPTSISGNRNSTFPGGTSR